MLLRNEGGLLPLPKRGKIGVIGGFANQMRVQGAGSSKVRTARGGASPLEAMRSALGDLSAEVAEIAFADGFDARHAEADAALIDQVHAQLGKCRARVHLPYMAGGVARALVCRGRHFRGPAPVV